MKAVPEFDKRPLKEFKEGDVLSGKVMASAKGEGRFVGSGWVLVDVDAIVPAFLPEKGLKGAAPESYQKGQEVKVKVEKLTRHEMKVILED